MKLIFKSIYLVAGSRGIVKIKFPGFIRGAFNYFSGSFINIEQYKQFTKRIG